MRARHVLAAVLLALVACVATAADLTIAPGRRAYVHVARGDATVNGHALGAGDAAMLEGEPQVRIGNATGAEVLVFDLP